MLIIDVCLGYAVHYSVGMCIRCRTWYIYMFIHVSTCDWRLHHIYIWKHVHKHSHKHMSIFSWIHSKFSFIQNNQRYRLKINIFSKWRTFKPLIIKVSSLAIKFLFSITMHEHYFFWLSSTILYTQIMFLWA